MYTFVRETVESWRNQWNENQREIQEEEEEEAVVVGIRIRVKEEKRRGKTRLAEPATLPGRKMPTVYKSQLRKREEPASK